MGQSFNRRQRNYDLLRIVSTVAVIIIHSNWIFFKPLYESVEFSFTWIFLALTNIITRFSVPAFVMLSGAFILSNEQNANMTNFYKRSLKKIFLPTALIIIFFIGAQIVINILEKNGLMHDLKSVLRGDFYTLWYIYMLGGLYFITPFIVRIKNLISYKQYKLLAFVMMAWAIISQATSNERLAYSIGVVFAFLSYYLMGDVLKFEIDRGWNPPKWILLIISVFCISISFIWRAKGHNYYISNAYTNFFSPSIVIFSLSIFTLFGTLKTKIDCSKLAGITFEIYLVHMMILKCLTSVIQTSSISPILVELLLILGTFVISLIIAIGYKKLWQLINRSDKFNRTINNLRIWEWLS